MIHKRKAFADLCKIAPRELSVYIQRGKVILTKGRIDDSIQENAEFLASRKEMDGKINIIVKEKKLSPEQNENEKRTKRHLELNTKVKELEIEEREESIQLLRLKKEKQVGYLIPTDLVKQLISGHFRSVTIAFQQGADTLLLEISKKKSYQERRQQA